MALSIATGQVFAADDDRTVGDRLHEVERALEAGRGEADALKRKAGKLAHQLEEARRESVTAAKAIQDHESELSRLEAELANLVREEGTIRGRLTERRVQHARVLSAIERLARRPPATLIAESMPPGDIVRSAILLRSAVPAIRARARGLEDELAALAQTRREKTARREALDAETARFESERARLTKLATAYRDMKRRTDAESRAARDRVRALAGEAKSLRELLARLGEERRGREAREKAERERVQVRGPIAPVEPRIRAAAPPITKARGSLTFPAAGQVVGLYGQATDSGLTRKGIIVRTRDEAQVVAPYDGLVVFADRFRGYGQLLIIEHGEGYHFLLAGLNRIDAEAGQRVVAGEPVGLMGRKTEAAPTLYLEFRRDGRPINPLPWLAARKGKVRG
ncbi:MAG: peptidoglycan DD-metalloendopeptidase family protein [Rhodospirillales bacterium]|nr:peptidoglycan DD-metalloendopeptidase family protein [Rhodospirillales bacterium]MDP6804791.1 peptidoglycan DD-metalloendopeptidase family protein [Rhodospirillales bacterium]